MDFELKIIKESSWPAEFQKEWVRLFARCYLVSERKALSVMEKYELNDSWCCAMYAEENLVGCYSGLVLEWQERKIFLTKISIPEPIQNKKFEEAFIVKVLEFIQNKNLRVVPTSPKIAGFVRRNRRYKELLPVGIKL